MGTFRRAFSTGKPEHEGLAEGELIFTLTTPDRDTYKTRFNPMGARFRPAKPWLDSHDDGTAKNTIAVFEPVYQGPDALRVKTRFDMKDPHAAEIYRKHVEGFLDGCSHRFDPIESHVEATGDEPCTKCISGMTEDGPCFACFGTGCADTTLVYDVYDILEGSSCAVPSNPNALMVRAAGVIEDKAAAAIRSAKSTTIQTLIFSKDKFSKAEAVKWAKEHDHKTEVDETEDSYRLRQRDPDTMTGMKTITLTDGIKAVVGHVKEKRTAEGGIVEKPVLAIVGTGDREHIVERNTRLDNTPYAPVGPIAPYHPIGMKPEHRSHYRYAIGDHLRMAHDHMDMHRMSEHEPHRKFHREHAMHNMRAAGTMCRMLADEAAEGHDDALQDAGLVTSMMRACPVEGDAEMAKEWETTQRSALPYADRTFADVCQEVGAKTPTDAMIRFATAKTTTEAYRKMLKRDNDTARATENSQRKELIESLRSSTAGLEPGLEAQMLGFDPVAYDPSKKDNVRKGQPWALDAIRRYQSDVEGQVTPIVRSAPLKTVAAVSAEPVNPSAAAVPAPANTRSGQLAPELERKIAEASRANGTDPEKLRATMRRVMELTNAQ